MTDSFRKTISELRSGGSQAARRVHERFVYRLVALAQARLNERFHRKIEAEDVVQSVFRSFFRRVDESQFE
ncbi:MAG: ECF-type sigma factor, partial [Planctomycetota bacterium]